MKQVIKQKSGNVSAIIMYSIAQMWIYFTFLRKSSFKI